MANRGVLYCAMGNGAYLEAALIGAISLRQLEPNIPITLISDHPLLKILSLEDYEINPRFIQADELNVCGSFSSREVKTRLSTFSPYTETLFLDADIIPLKPLSLLWNYLLQGDMAMALDRLPKLDLCDHISQEEKSYTLQYLPGNTVHFNSGVILWRKNPKTQELFHLWHQEWLKFKKQDQLALIRAINSSQIPITKLPCNYNISPRDAASMLVDASFLHCWGGTVLSGQFRQIAQGFYPNIIEQVANLRDYSQCKISFSDNRIRNNQ
jgi:Glycosyl transferase family 8